MRNFCGGENLMKEYIGLIGVILGFFLSQLATTWRERRKAKRAVKLIMEELRANLAVLPQRRDVVSKVKIELDRKKVRPGQGVPFLTRSYDYNIHLAYPVLSPIERDNLHVVYERLKFVDSFLSSFEADLMKHLERKLVDNPYALYSIRMEEILENFRVVEDLISKHLKGEPVDVFYRLRESNPPQKFA